MPQKKLNGTTHGFIGDSPTKYKAPVKVYVERPSITAYKLKRDISLLETVTDPVRREQLQTNIAILEMQLFGVKSAKGQEIVTDQQLKERKTSRHAEISLQATYCQWIKDNYPNVKFIRHEREKRRSYVEQNLMKKLNSAGSMPDHEFLEPVGKYLGLLIEFKRLGEHWLMADGITVKKSYVDQYENHCMLWEKGYVVYFCNDLEIAKKIFIQYYVEKRNMRQRIYNVK